jgi:hypothetical protein
LQYGACRGDQPVDRADAPCFERSYCLLPLYHYEPEASTLQKLNVQLCKIAMLGQHLFDDL